MMYDNWSYGHNDGNTIFGFVFMLVIMVIFVLVIIALIHHFNKLPKYGSHPETALDILSKRYANGEIDKKEFEEKRKDLR